MYVLCESVHCAQCLRTAINSLRELRWAELSAISGSIRIDRN